MQRARGGGEAYPWFNIHEESVAASACSSALLSSDTVNRALSSCSPRCMALSVSLTRARDFSAVVAVDCVSSTLP